MKNLAFGALLVGLLVACGGGKDSKIHTVDGGTDAPMVCDLLKQTGCMANEKCTWIVDVDSPTQYVGHIGCAPTGAADVDQPCMFGDPGVTGYDECKAGYVCSTYARPWTSTDPDARIGFCKQICDQQGGPNAPCDASHVCVTYGSLFSTGDNTPNAAGVCDLACDPIKDNDFDGAGTASMKSTNTCGTKAEVGCYGYPSLGTPPKTAWSCTNDINYTKAQPTGLRHRVQCTEANGCARTGNKIYINSCNQGYLPLLYESSMVSIEICTALCEPLNCFAGTDNCGVGAATTNRVGKSGSSCAAPDRVGTFDNSTAIKDGVETGGEHCRYIWQYERDMAGTYLPSDSSNTLGFCYDHSKYMYDSNGDNMADKYLPACYKLADGFSASTDATMPYTFWGAANLGCVDTSHAPGLAQGKKMPESAMQKEHLLNLPRPLYHRELYAR